MDWAQEAEETTTSSSDSGSDSEGRWQVVAPAGQRLSTHKRLRARPPADVLSEQRDAVCDEGTFEEKCRMCRRTPTKWCYRGSVHLCDRVGCFSAAVRRYTGLTCNRCGFVATGVFPNTRAAHDLFRHSTRLDGGGTYYECRSHSNARS